MKIVSNIGISAGLVTGTVNLGTVIAPTAVGWVGFTSSGVAASSWAALWQSSIGNVCAGSMFAALQSYGATATAATLGSVGVGVVAPIAGAAAIYYYWPNKKD